MCIRDRLNVHSKKNQVINLGDIKAKRDYVHIDDVCNAFLSVVKTESLSKGVETYNICSGVATSAEDIVHIIQKLRKLNIQININEVLFRSDEMDIEFGSNYKAKEMLDWSPEISLKDGLLNIINKL
mgnify:FL=1